MANVNLLPDFKEFLKLLNAHQVEYLLIGGYAVVYHGYPCATADEGNRVRVKFWALPVQKERSLE